jgi:starch synthase
MKVLILSEYPPAPGGLSTQGDLLYRGLREIGVDVRPVDLESSPEKEWYYRWFRPDVALGIGYWGHTPDLVLHPKRFGVLPVPWLVADGFIAAYCDVLNELPLILVTSTWVRDVYARDGVNRDIIDVLPVGCDTDAFVPRSRDDPEVVAVRESFGVAPDEVMLLTVGGDAASKGAREVMQALAGVKDSLPPWRYVCKVWPQPRSEVQNRADLELAADLGLADRVSYVSGRVSRNFMPYLLAACDIYAGPSRLDGFGMPQVEAGACGKPVIGINAMALLDTLVHGETALLASVGQEIHIGETTLGAEAGFPDPVHVTFNPPVISDYRANSSDIASYLVMLMNDPDLRLRLGQAARARVVAHYDYRIVAAECARILTQRLGIQ